jgi:hypothetical protein
MGPTIASAEVDVDFDGSRLPAQARRIANQAGKALEPRMKKVGDRVGREFITGMDGQMRQVPANAMRAIREIDTKEIGREKGMDLAGALGDGVRSRSHVINSALARALAGGDFSRQGNQAGRSFSEGLQMRLEREARQRIDKAVAKMLSGFGDAGGRGGSRLADAFNNAFHRDVTAGMDRTVRLVLGLIGSIGPQLAALGSGLSASLVALLSSAIVGLGGALLILGGPLAATIAAHLTLKTEWKHLLETSQEVRGAVKGLSKAWKEQAKAMSAAAIEGILPLIDALEKLVEKSHIGNALGASVAAIADAFTDVVKSPGFSAFLTAMETTFPAAMTLFGRATASITQALLTMWTTAGPAAVALGESFAGWAANFADAMQAMADSGQLAAFFDQALASLGALFGLINPLAHALGNVFLIGSETGNSMLDTLGELAERFVAFTQSAAGSAQIREWFADGEEIFNALIDLIGSLSTTLSEMVTPKVIDQVVAFMGALGDLLPLVGDILSTIGELNLVNIVTNMLIGIASAIGPLLPLLGDLFAAIGDMDPSVWQGLAVVIAIFVGALRLIGPLIGPISALFELMGSGAGIMTVLRAVVTGVGIALRALFVALAANPVGLLIAAVVALVGVLIWFFSQTEVGRKAWASFVDWLQGLWAGLSEWFTGTFVPAMAAVWDAIVSGAKAIGGFFADLWQGLLDAPQALIDWFTGTLVPFFASLPQLLMAGLAALGTLVTDVFMSIVTWFTGTFLPFLASLPMLVAGFLGSMVGFFISLPGRIIGGIATLVSMWLQFWTDLFVLGVQLVTTGIEAMVAFFQALPGRVEALWNAFTAWWTAFWPALWDTAVTTAQTGVNAVVTFFQQLPGRIEALWNAFTAWWTAFWPALWNAAVTFVQNGVQAVLTWFSNLVTRAVAFATNLKTGFLNLLSTMWTTAVTTVSNAVATILDTVSGWVDSFIGFITDLGVRFFTEMLASMDEGDRAAVEGIATLLATVGKIPGQVMDAIGDLGSTLYNAGRDLIGGLIGGIADAIPDLLTKAGNIAQDVINTVTGKKGLDSHSPSRVFRAIGGDVVAGLVQGMENNARSASLAAATLARGSIGAFDNASPVNASYSNTRNNNVAAGAIQIVTQTTDPVIAANMVLDRLVTRMA